MNKQTCNKQACSFTKNEFFHGYFSRILPTCISLYMYSNFRKSYYWEISLTNCFLIIIFNLRFEYCLFNSSTKCSGVFSPKPCFGDSVAIINKLSDVSWLNWLQRRFLTIFSFENNHSRDTAPIGKIIENWIGSCS